MASGQKIGLVVEGGGMKCAYSAGVLDGFMDAQLRFDYCIGVSAGSGNVASFVAGQRGRNLRFFTTHTHSPDYFGLKSFVKTGDLFGLQYIYGDLTNSPGPDPLDYDAFVRSPAVYQAAVTNALTGKPEYFGKETIHSNDFRLLMASCAMPVFCRPVELYGVPYFDGGLTDAIPARHALAQGCDRVVVILSKTRGYVKKPQGMHFVYSRACRKYPKIVEAIENRHIVYNQNLQDIFRLEKEGKAFVFAPSRPIHVNTFSMKEQDERDTYDLGLADFRAQQARLAQFIAAAGAAGKTEN